MAKEFKKLLGNRIYLEAPPKEEEGKIVVDENTKEALMKEFLQKLKKLKIYAVGSGVTDETLKEGEWVLVDPGALRNAHVIPLSDEREVLLVSVFDIIHVWS